MCVVVKPWYVRALRVYGGYMQQYPKPLILPTMARQVSTAGKALTRSNSVSAIKINAMRCPNCIHLKICTGTNDQVHNRVQFVQPDETSQAIVVQTRVRQRHIQGHNLPTVQQHCGHNTIHPPNPDS